MESITDDLIRTRICDEKVPLSYRLLALELDLPFNEAKQRLFAFQELHGRGSARPLVEAVYGLAGWVIGSSSAATSQDGDVDMSSASDKSVMTEPRLELALVRESELESSRSRFDTLVAEYVHALVPVDGTPPSASALYSSEKTGINRQLSIEHEFGAKSLPFAFANHPVRPDAAKMLKGIAPAVLHSPVKRETKPSIAAQQPRQQPPPQQQKSPQKVAPKRTSAGGPSSKAAAGGLSSFFSKAAAPATRFEHPPSQQQKIATKSTKEAFEDIDDLSGLVSESSRDHHAAAELALSESEDDGSLEDIAGPAKAKVEPVSHKNRKRVLVDSDSSDSMELPSPSKKQRLQQGDAQSRSPVAKKTESHTAAKADSAASEKKPKAKASPKQRQPRKLRAEVDAGAGSEVKTKGSRGRQALIADDEDEFAESEDEEQEEQVKQPKRRGPRLPTQATTLDSFAKGTPIPADETSQKSNDGKKRVIRRRVKKEIEYVDAEGYTVFDEKWTDEEVEVSDHEQEVAAKLQEAHQANERVARISEQTKQAVLPGAKKAAEPTTKAAGAAAAGPSSTASKKKKPQPKNASITSFFAPKR